MRLSPPLICVLTRARGDRGSPERTHLIARLSAAAAAGASMIQIRERQMDDRTLLDFTCELIAATRHTSCLVTLNDRVDIALAAAANGVHLKSDGFTAADIRRITSQDLVIGRSVHSTTEAIQAQEDGGYDYIFFGTVFPSASKPADHPIAGLEALRQVCSQVSLPVVAIGGITPSRADTVATAGASGAAAISVFAEARDTAEAVEALRAALTRSRGRV